MVLDDFRNLVEINHVIVFVFESWLQWKLASILYFLLKLVETLDGFL